jgi:hypothetical protein
MSKFKIKLARIETARGSRADPHIRVTFWIERAGVKFQVPIDLSMRDYDDTEMVQAARGVLHRTLVDLAAQTGAWTLSPQELRRLSSMSRRPSAPTRRAKSAR